MLKKTVFLDRDGVLNFKRDDYVKSENELVIIPDIAKELQLLQNNDYELIIITNQSAINRGIISMEQESKINAKLIEFLKRHNVHIKKIYLCPHKPEENCNCRKPKTGLFESAIKEFNININDSWFIGDSASDEQAAMNLGLKFLKHKTNSSIHDAVQYIINNS